MPRESERERECAYLKNEYIQPHQEKHSLSVEQNSEMKRQENIWSELIRKWKYSSYPSFRNTCVYIVFRTNGSRKGENDSDREEHMEKKQSWSEKVGNIILFKNENVRWKPISIT